MWGIKKSKEPFTKQEQEIMDLIIEAHNRYVELDSMHPDHNKEWVRNIHNLQMILNQRVLIRDYPETFKDFRKHEDTGK